MTFILSMTLSNTLFWICLHFWGAAFITTTIPSPVRRRRFDYRKPFFEVSQGELSFYRRIKLPAWKDRLPQYNKDFDKRHLRNEMTPAYVREFLFMTCQAEIVHYSIAVAGYLSLFFCMLCDDPIGNLPLFFCIATFIGLCNIPFALIQRYNRYRLVKVLGRMESRGKPAVS